MEKLKFFKQPQMEVLIPPPAVEAVSHVLAHARANNLSKKGRMPAGERIRLRKIMAWHGCQIVRSPSKAALLLDSILMGIGPLVPVALRLDVGPVDRASPAVSTSNLSAAEAKRLRKQQRRVGS
jgi:hypothetical protein